MTVKFTNNASSTLSSGINSSVTSLTVASASAFPQLAGADDYCYLTIQQATGTAREVVKATALSSNTFTIIRAQDNTTAQSFSAGDTVELRMTAALLTDVIDAATVEGVKTNFQYTPTAGQTVFSGADNSSNTMIINQSGLVNVYMNGVRLVQGTDYTVSAANNTITLTTGATTADIIDIEVYGNFTGQSGAAVAITGGSITGTAITATTLGASGTATLNTFVSNNATISGGTINNVAIGGTTQAAGAFTSLTSAGLTVDTTTLVVDATNNRVGIGTSSPADALHVLDSSGNAYASIARDTQSQGEVGLRLRGGTSGNDWYVYQKTSSNNLNFYNTADRLTIDSSGQVGIGTSSPDTLMELRGADPILTIRDSSTSSTAGNATLRLAETGANDALDQYFDIKATAGQLQIIDNWNEGGGTGTRVVIDDSGNVGIGTSNPASLLTIQAATPTVEIDSTTTSNTATFQFTSSGTVDSKITHVGNTGVMTIDSGRYAGWGGKIAFATDTETRMFIDQVGNVGIGTSSPNSVAKLQVEDITASNTSTYISVVSGNGGNAGLAFGDSDSDLRGGVLYNNADNALRFFGKNAFSEAGRFDVNGNLLVRQTSAVVRDTNAGSDVQAFWGNQFSSSSATTTKVMIGSGSSQGYVGMSRVNTDSKYITNAYIRFDNSVFTAGSEAGFMSFYTQSGGANAAERMILDPSGKLLLATTNTGGTFSVERNGNTYNISAVSDANNTSEGFFRGYSTGAGADRVIIYSNGNIVNAGNSYHGLSDLKLKENIVDSGSQWDDVKSVRVRKYSLKLDQVAEANQLGVIAQELEESGMAGLVYESADRDIDGNDLGTTTKQVKYSILYMKAVKALQEAMDRIETLEAKVQQLENN